MAAADPASPRFVGSRRTLPVVAVRDLIVDAWSALSHKAAMGGDGLTAGDTLAPTWVPKDAARRLTAYKVLAAYIENTARAFLPDGISEQERRDRREYGDPALLRDRVVAGVLGDDWEITVDGADADLPDEPNLPPEPEALGDSPTPLRQRIHAARVARWDAAAAQAVDDWERAWAAQPALLERQRWLRDWADAEQLPAKIVEGEGDTVGLGDGVYTLAWSTAKQRPIVEVYDPGLYFPVLTDGTRDFPTKVHIAWELEVADHKFVRRLTWELVDLASIAVLDDAGVTVETDRTYPWNDEPSTVTCVFSDATWPWDDLAGRTALDLDETRATFATNEDGVEARRLDLHIDFLPVIHVPNTPAHREHFGRSVLSVVAQLFDDIAQSDTDIQAAASLAAGPVIALSGDTALPQGRPVSEPDINSRHYQPTGTGSVLRLPPTIDVRPGVVHRLGPNGRMDVLDLSAGLEELRNVNGSLLDRLSVNGRVPAEVLGRTDATQAMPGISITLRFGPFTQLVGMLRMTREPKYALLLKFAARLAQAGLALEAGPDIPARIAFGSFLPSDRSQLVTEVTELLNAKAISRQTAVALLVAGGLTIDDAQGEVDRIKADDAAAAKDVADATGSEQLAAEWLDLEIPAAIAKPVVPVITLPPPTPPSP